MATRFPPLDGSAPKQQKFDSPPEMGIDPNKHYYTPDGRPVHLVSDPTPIHELMG